jgi:ZIP family zinc transporter
VIALMVTAVSCCATLIGGWVAMRAQDRRHLVLGVAAGVLLGVVAFDLLPEALAGDPTEVFHVPAPLLTFALGFLALHVIERSVAVHRGHEGEYGAHGHGHERAPSEGRHGGGNQQNVGLLAGGALVAHSVMDGFGIGAAFQAATAIGVAVAIAVVAHDFADGFNTYTITSLYGNARRRAVTLLILDAIAPIVGASITLLVDIPAHALALYLGFFAGFLLYLATADILPEAHSQHNNRLTLACTVAGVGAMWLVIGLAG